MQEKVILGIDPGTSIMGYGLIKVINKSIEFLEMDIIKLDNLKDHPLKLKEIFFRCTQILEKHLPDEMSIEAPFFGKNVQSMLKLGRAQGVAIAAAINKSVPVFEYQPRKIKQSITGNGNASKEQVAFMLQGMLKLKKTPVLLDATDGLATAVCHYFQGGKTNTSGYKSWKSFISQNPDRLGLK